MPFTKEHKLVIAVASSALFDLSESDKVYREHGDEAYRIFQEKNIDVPLAKGVAFPFIRRILNINNAFPEQQPVEVVLMSRNSTETGMRVFRTIQHYGLDITKASFFSGKSPYEYLPAFGVSLFLSANTDDVRNAIKAGYAAGRVLDADIEDDEKDYSLRLAFDFDGVLADDAAETVYKTTHDLQKFHEFETTQSSIPHNAGPLKDLLQKISYFQKLETEKLSIDNNYNRLLNISLITARCSPSHERVVSTLKSWGISVDQAFFLGGEKKSKILEILKPHMYFDDQITHLEHVDNIPLVHIPFGIANK
jgi:5'-nucleotidase